MSNQTHPDLKQIMWRTVYAQFVYPTVSIVVIVAFKAAGYLGFIPYFFLPIILLIAYSIGVAMIAVYSLVNLFTKLSAPKAKDK